MDVLRRALGRKPKKEHGVRSEFIDPAQKGMDVTYVTPRILIVGRPTNRETSMDDRRINQKELAKYLEQKFDNSYLLFNLSSKTRDQIDYSVFKNQVAEFAPYNRTDVLDDVPSIGMVFRVIYTLEFWLNWDAGTVAVLFCNNSLARSAFFVSSYLVYTGVQPSMEAAFAAVSEQRTGDPQALRANLWPSWLRVMTGVDKILRGDPCLPKVQGLTHVILQCPELRAYLSGREEQGGRNSSLPVLQLFQGPKILWDSSQDCDEEEGVRWEDDKLVAEVIMQGQPSGTPDLVLCGDYQLWVSLPERPSAYPRSRPSSPGASGRMPGLEELGQHKSEDTVYGQGGDKAGQGVRTVDPRLLVGRWVFHTSCIDLGVATLPTEDCDIFRPQLTSGFVLNLITAPVAPEIVASINLDRLMRRSFLNLREMRALQQGANDFSSRHYCFPDTKLHQQLVKEGIDTTAAVCALQRANNAMGRAREALDCPSMKDIFKEASAMRDLQLIRATLTNEEIAGVLAARANMAVKKRGTQMDELDFSGLLAAAKLGNVTAGGKGDGTGKGKGKGGGRGGRGKRHKKKKKGKDSDSDSDDDSDGSGGHSSGSGSTEAEEEKEKDKDKADDDVAALIGKNGPQGKLFEGDAPVKDVDEEDEEEEVVEDEGGEDWVMKDHPIFGKWFKALADGSKTKAAILEDMAKEQWNPALLECDPNAIVPDMPATTVPLKDWTFMEQYAKMSKVGLPRPMVEHRMLKESVNPALLDADPNTPPSATIITPPKKSGSKKPSIVRKKLHWVPIKGKVEGTLWGGPPGDLVAAAAQLITDEEEFNRLFIQRPEDLKKKKKKDGGGVVQLLDHKRAMNCGIALAKLHMAYSSVVECLTRMAARTKDGKGLLTGVELQNLVTLSPTDEEVKIVKGFKGDVNRLGPAEKFFLAVADVPGCKARAAGLYYQFEFDERVKASRARIKTFTDALGQVKEAQRLRRLLKAVLVLGNKMNGIDKEHRKGVVKAFTVASLHQLYLTKAFDPTVSVLQYLFKLLRRVDPDLLRLGKDFPGAGALLGEAARLPLDTLSGDVKELREGLTSLEATVKAAADEAGGLANLLGGADATGAVYIEETVEVENNDSSSSSSEEEEAPGGDAAAGGSPGTDKKKKKKRKVRKIKRRVESLPVFVSLAQTELSVLNSEFDAAVTGYKELVKWFKEDPELAADDMFGSLRMFIQTWETQLKLLADKKRKEKEAKKRAKEMAKRKEELERKRAGGGSDSGSGSESGSGSDSGSSSSSGSSSGSDSEDGSGSGSSKSKAKAGPANSKAALLGLAGALGTPGRGKGKAGAGAGAGKTPAKTPGKGKGKSKSKSKSKSASSSSGESSDYNLDSAKAAGKGPAAWATAQGQGAADDDDDDEDEAPKAGGGGGGNPMGGLLAAIKAKAASPAPDAGGGSGDKDKDSAAGDRRGGLLAAIKAKAGGGGTSPAPKGSPAPSNACASPAGSAGGGGDGGDPRSSLLAAIAKRGGGAGGATPAKADAKAASGSPGGASNTSDPKAGGGSPATAQSTAKAGKPDEGGRSPEGWRVGKDEGDDPEADGRNALMAAIAKRRQS